MLKNVLIGTGVVVATGIVAVRVHNKNIYKKIDQLNQEFEDTISAINNDYITVPGDIPEDSKYEQCMKAQEEYNQAWNALKSKLI